MVMEFPPVPKSIKSLNHFIKIAQEHEERQIVVAYWTLMYAVQHAMKELPGKKPTDVSMLLMSIMDWLEQTKTANADVEGISNETTAQAMLEDYILKLFAFAESEEKNERYNKKMVKAYYTSSILFDTLQQFGPLSEDIEEKKKFAKWRATHIHSCLKVGEQPIAPDTLIHYTKEDEMINGFTEEVQDEDQNEDPFAKPPPTSSFPIPPEYSILPPPPEEPANVSAVLPEIPTVSPTRPQIPTVSPPTVSANSASLGPDQMEKAQKYCKWASSALNYDDVKTAIDNLQKALHLLQYGQEM